MLVASVVASVAVMPTESARADEPSPVAGPTGPADGMAPAPAVPSEPELAATRVVRLATLLDHRRVDPRLGSNVSYLVTDARTGAVLAQRHAGKPMQPASNMKIVTAVTAIAALGADRRLRTRVVALPSSDGRRHVAVVGVGDSLLSRSGVTALARRTARELGKGTRIVVHPDASLFPHTTLAPGWIPQLLGSSVGHVRSLGMVGDRSRAPAKNVVRVFASALRAQGLAATTGPQRTTGAGARVLAQAPGHTIGDAVGTMLRVSDSSIAEVLFRLVALSQGKPGTWAGGRQAAAMVLESLGIDASDARLVDGSGLSKEDRITPRLLVRTLQVARFEQPQRFAAIFRSQAMPVAGRSGTLTTAYGRYSTAPSRCARGRVQAKTGTIFQTISLSGIAATAGGGDRVFSIIVNERPSRYDRLATRRAVDGLAATITGCWR